MNEKPIVLSVCDRSGVMVQPWADAGWECWCVDITHPPGEREVAPGLFHVGADVRHWLPPMRRYAIVFTFPPCTHLASSGARWFRSKGLRGLIDGLELVERCRSLCEWSSAPWMLENPVGTLSTYWRKPDFSFDPFEYGGYLDPPGDAYTKRTCLWVGNGFVIPESNPVWPIEGSRMHTLPATDDRAEMRSVTPAGFAKAVFLANHEAASRRLGMTAGVLT